MDPDVEGLAEFVWERETRVVFGAGSRARLAEEMGLVGVARGPLLYVCDPAVGDVRHAIESCLRDAGHTLRVVENTAGEPGIEVIERAATIAQTCTAVVALGGGSTLDIGKLAACHADAPTEVRAHALAVLPLPERRRKLICLPSTAGTGAEVTRTAVFTADGTKLWSWGDPLRPDLAVLDPELTVGLPAAVTAMTGLDALVHAIEAATIRTANPTSCDDGLRAVRLINTWLRRAVDTPEDLPARGAMQIAACLAGLAIDASGTGAAHALGHGLGSLAAIPHGRAGARAALRSALERGSRPSAVRRRSRGPRSRRGPNEPHFREGAPRALRRSPPRCRARSRPRARWSDAGAPGRGDDGTGEPPDGRSQPANNGPR